MTRSHEPRCAYQVGLPYNASSPVMSSDTTGPFARGMLGAPPSLVCQMPEIDDEVPTRHLPRSLGSFGCYSSLFAVWFDELCRIWGLIPFFDLAALAHTA